MAAHLRSLVQMLDVQALADWRVDCLCRSTAICCPNLRYAAERMFLQAVK